MKRLAGPVFTSLLVLAVALYLYGGCLAGGRFPADPTCATDTWNYATLLEVTAKHLGEGSFPLVYPEFEAGYPVAAAWMYGLFSPTLLPYLVLPVDAAWGLSAVVLLVFAGAGMHLLARSLLEDEVAAAVAAVLFAVSQFTVGRIFGGQQNIAWAAAWVPWACWAARRALAGGRGGAGLLGLTLGLGLLAGHVQVWFYGGPALLVLASVGGRGKGVGTKGVRALVLGGALALGIASVQWLFTLEHVRFVGSPDLGYSPAELFSTPLHGLAEKVFPGFLAYRAGGELIQGFYPHESFGLAGGGALVLVVLGVLGRVPGRFRLFALLLAGLLLAPGPTNPVSATLNRIPPLSFGRTPGRALFLVVLAGSLLAGGAVAYWLSVAKEGLRRRLLAAPLVVAAVAAAAGFSLYRFAESRPDPARFLADWGYDAVARSVLALSIVAAALLAARHRRRLRLALPVAVLAAGLVSGVPDFGTMPSASYYTDWFADLPEDARAHRLHLLGTPQMPNPERLGGRTLRSLANATSAGFRRFVDTIGPTDEWQYWLDVRYGLAGIPVGVLTSEDGDPHARIEFAREPVGHARLFGRAASGLSDEAVLDRLARGSRELFLAGKEGGLRGTGPPGGSVAPVRERASGSPNRMEFLVESEAPGLLFTSVQYHPLWTATVNDRPAAVRRANVAFMAVEVPPGRSRVVFRFQSRLVPIGAGISLASLLLTAVLAFGRRRGRSAPRAL